MGFETWGGGIVATVVVVGMMSIPTVRAVRLIRSGLRGSRIVEMCALIFAGAVCTAGIIPMSTVSRAWIVLPAAVVVVCALNLSVYAAGLVWAERARKRTFLLFFLPMATSTIAMAVLSWGQMRSALALADTPDATMGRPEIFSVLLLVMAPLLLTDIALIVMFVRALRRTAGRASI